MPWGYECRQKLIKQNVLQPTRRTKAISQEIDLPGPTHYEPTIVFGGPGYSKIKRMPAYTFGILTKPIVKPTTRPNAPIFNVSKLGRKGPYRIPGSVVGEKLEGPSVRTKTPGPANYAPRGDSRFKNPPAYTMAAAAKPPYQAWDMWTPPPNMYLPPLMDKRPPAYSLPEKPKPLSVAPSPGPGVYEPNFDYVKKKKPAYSFGYPYRAPKLPTIPAPNRYCERKFNAIKRSIPAPSFGIRHSQYASKREPILKPEDFRIEVIGE